MAERESGHPVEHMHDTRWDAFAQDYDAVFLGDPLYEDTLRLIVELLKDADGKSVLELGCGTGNVIEAVLERYPKTHIAGVDPSEGMRARCAGKFPGDDRVEVREGDALHLPYPEAHFDFVVTNYTLHHLLPEEREPCAAEMARVLKPGGRLLYSDFFTSVDALPEDPERIRDIIKKMMGQALYSLDRGAQQLMMIKLATLPAVLRAEGEYYTTLERWMELLGHAGLAKFEVVDVPPGDFGLHILRATRVGG